MQLLDHDNAAVSESRLLHTDPSAFVCVSGADETGTWRDRFYQARLIAPALCSAQNTAERYISQASYVRRSRTTCHVNAIRTAFVDFDCVAILGHEPDDAFIDLLLDRAFCLGLPRPSLIIRSGRGFHAKWIFREALGAHQLPSWKALNAALVDIFGAIGGDTSVKDASRVLRVIGSINSQASEQYRQVSVVHDRGELVEFDKLFEQTIAAYAEITIENARRSSCDPAERARGSRRVRQMAQLIAAHPTNLAGLRDYEARLRPLLCNEQGFAAGEGSRKSLRGLNWRRFVDLRHLIQMRGGAPVGSRDLYVFWMLNHLALSGQVSAERFGYEAQELIRHFPRHDGFDPLGKGQLSSLVDRLSMRESGTRIQFNGVWYDPMYTPTNDYLINTFGITDEEQRSLVTIISHAERQRRAILRDPSAAGRSERRQARQERAQSIQALGTDIRKSLNRAQHRAGATAHELIEHVEASVRRAQSQLREHYRVSERQARRLVQGVASEGKERVMHLVQTWRVAGMQVREIALRVGRSTRQVLRWLAQMGPIQPAAPAATDLPGQGLHPPLEPSLRPPAPTPPADEIAAPTHVTLAVSTGDITDIVPVTNGRGPLVCDSCNSSEIVARTGSGPSLSTAGQAEGLWREIVAQKEAAEQLERTKQAARALARLFRAACRTGNANVIERLRERIAQNPHARALIEPASAPLPGPRTA